MVVLEHPRLGESIEEAFSDYGAANYGKMLMIIIYFLLLYVLIKDIYLNYTNAVPLKEMTLKIITTVLLSLLSIYSVKSLFLD